MVIRAAALAAFLLVGLPSSHAQQGTVPAPGQSILSAQSRLLPVLAQKGMVSSQERRASEIGVEIMKRGGNDQKPGCNLTLNDNNTSTISASVNTGWPQGTILADALDTGHTVTVQTGGMATLYAPSRGYRVYVNQDDL